MNRQRILPSIYQQALSNLSSINFAHPRDLPKWGDIFSQFCLFARLADYQEEELFLDRVNDILNLHCQIATSTPAVISEIEEDEILSAQHYYCNKQQQNDKTRRVLEKSLGEVWTDRYMSKMLFDFPYVH